jgi:hypothetical protein
MYDWVLQIKIPAVRGFEVFFYFIYCYWVEPVHQFIRIFHVATVLL